MNKIKFPRELTKQQEIDIKDLLDAMEKSTNEEIDSTILSFWKEIVYWYTFWLLTDSNRNRIKEYKEYRDKIKSNWLELFLSQKMSLLEYQYEENPEIFQLWKIPWRIVVASVKTILEWKEEKKIANWWSDMIIEIYEQVTPKAYEYAKKHYSISN